MATTEQLLKLSPRGAIVRMINDENNTLFDGSKQGPLTISPPLDVGGLRTEIEIGVRRQLSGHDALPYAGQLAFRFNRLDVFNTLVGKLAGFRPPMPTSTQVLLDELTRRTGISFDTEDFVLEDIKRNNAAPYVLKAKIESLRWIGEVEVQLVDLTNLTTYIAGGVPSGSAMLRFDSPDTNTKDNQPYLNATVHRQDLSGLNLNSPVSTATDPLVAFVRKTVPSLESFLRDESTPWIVSQIPADYNLLNAVLVSKDENLSGLNPLVPAAGKVARVRLSSLDTAYGSKDLLIPYAQPNLNNSAFNDTPRLKATAVVNASNGTPWNLWLNSLSVPSVITSLPTSLNLRFSGPDQWIADVNNPSPTNLYNAVVQYNGPRRAYDQRPYFSESNRVLVLTLSSSNTAYQGNVTFHYRAPIVINENLPNSILGTAFDFDLAPSEGTGPYTFTLVSGALAPDHVLDANHHIVGPSDTLGSFTATYDVEDSAGVKVRYNVSYRTIIAELVLTGNPPSTIRNESYTFVFDVSGGLPGYTFNLIDLGGSSELNLPNPFEPRVEGYFAGNVGSRYYILEVTDQQGTVTQRSFTIVVSGG